jgi:hypothetical protein
VGGPAYAGVVLDLSSLDLEEIANALSDQTDYEHWWLINPQTGEIVFWAADIGIDGQTPVALDDLDLVCIDPLTSDLDHRAASHALPEAADCWWCPTNAVRPCPVWVTGQGRAPAPVARS